MRVGIATARTRNIVLSLMFLLASVAPLAAQISPGPLSAAHQDLEGVQNCVKCHAFGSGARELKCLDCHLEIQRRIKAGTGYHARVKLANASVLSCGRCHIEHSGRNFRLVRLDRKAFDHGTETGFALAGKHRALNCEQCHNGSKIAMPMRAEIKVRDPNHTLLGLRRECSTCHADQHKGQFGSDCARCHNSESWKTVPRFNHAETRFALTGLHAPVACAKCHTPNADGVQQFKGLPFAHCDNCHRDPHAGGFREAKFAGGCDGCHSTAGWKKGRPSPAFRHDQTRFALAGKHAEVECLRCHKDANFHRPVAHEECRDCHKDPHRGQFAARAAGSDCGSCHNERGFKPAQFDVAAHQRSAFPLTGKHLPLACASCHRAAGRETVFKTGTLKCAECHADAHAGEFAGAPVRNDCGQCHRDSGFRPSSFDRARHAATRFPLTGKHEQVECARCHKTLSVAALPVAAKLVAATDHPEARRQYHFGSLQCASCHSDPHQTRLACETCHEAADWKRTASFNHATTRFALDNAHAKALCIRCHAGPDAGKPPRFSGADARCSSCHSKDDRHRGQFLTGARDLDCSGCHQSSSWKIGAFDHDRTLFPLDRAHRNVACEKCHKEQAAGDSIIRRYRGTAMQCVECH